MPPAPKKILLKLQIVQELTRARKHFEYSFKKVSMMTLDHELDDEELETLESFSSRFSRFSDLVIMKYFRVLLLETDPAFRGSVIDTLNQAEKYGWIEAKEPWIRIRELRNVAAHEYSPEDIKQIYQELIQMAPRLMQLSLSL